MKRNEIIAFLLGLAVATVLVVLATVYVVNTYLVPNDPHDPLTKQGGLRRLQDTTKQGGLPPSPQKQFGN
jgi:hypothetical protein